MRLFSRRALRGRASALPPRLRALLAAAALLLGALLAMGCAPRLDELHVKPKLSHNALKQGKVALMPVAAAMEHVSRQELVLIDNLMYLAFKKHGHDLPNIPLPVVARAITSDIAHWDTLHRAINFGKVDYVSLYRLSEAVGARYIVFTRVTYGEEQPPLSSFESWLEKKYEKDDLAMNDGTPIYSIDNLCKARAKRNGLALSADVCTSSKLVVYSTLIDAKEGEMLWDAKHHVTRVVGNSKQNPNPSLLAWTLFSELFSNLPSADKK